MEVTFKTNLSSCIVVIDENDNVIYRDMNSLVDACEKEIREYLKQKDEDNKNMLRKEIEYAKSLRQEYINHIEEIDHDLKGMRKQLADLEGVILEEK